MNESRERVVVVTGASRGVGKGIAIALGASGATVYVSGRSQEGGKKHPLGGTVQATAAAVTEAGGRGIAVTCDHSDDEQVRQLFERVGDEQGRLDILVNNATAVPRELAKPGPFWEKSLDLLRILDVGQRSHYVASYFAAPILRAAREVHSSCSPRATAGAATCTAPLMAREKQASTRWRWTWPWIFAITTSPR